MAKFFNIRIHECGMSWHQKPELLAKDAAMDGIYVIRTSLPQEAMGAEQAMLTYKWLAKVAKVERAFRTMKSVDLQRPADAMRPLYHRTEERVKAHLFICMLAYYVEWHLREAWAPLLYTDEEGSQRDTPVSPVQASECPASSRKGVPMVWTAFPCNPSVAS